MSIGERGPHGDHGQTGAEGRRGVQGETGLAGARGERGAQGEPPGGVLRLTDRRILVLYVLVALALAFLALRTETNAHRIHERCRDLSNVTAELNARGAHLRLPDC
jgi:hypothetical protein